MAYRTGHVARDVGLRQAVVQRLEAYGFRNHVLHGRCPPYEPPWSSSWTSGILTPTCRSQSSLPQGLTTGSVCLLAMGGSCRVELLDSILPLWHDPQWSSLWTKPLTLWIVSRAVSGDKKHSMSNSGIVLLLEGCSTA